MALSSAVGSVLHATFAVIGRVRPSDKPLHPRGVVLPATVHRYGSDEPFGVEWLDEPGNDEAVVRFSRGGGLPESLPDVLGIALRVDLGDHAADILFATTGRGVPGRFLLRPRRAASVSETTHSTLQPYRTATGPVVLAATPRREESVVVIRLSAARPTGRWCDFGSVTVDAGPAAADEPIDFDPMLHEIPGLANYPWVRQVREGAYLAARRSRRERAAV